MIENKEIFPTNNECVPVWVVPYDDSKTGKLRLSIFHPVAGELVTDIHSTKEALEYIAKQGWGCGPPAVKIQHNKLEEEEK